MTHCVYLFYLIVCYDIKHKRYTRYETKENELSTNFSYMFN